MWRALSSAAYVGVEQQPSPVDMLLPEAEALLGFDLSPLQSGALAPALRPQASLPSPPRHTRLLPLHPSVCAGQPTMPPCAHLAACLPPTAHDARSSKSSTRKRRAAASSADPSVAIPVMAASVSPGVSSAARKASRLNPSCAATSHSCSAQPHAPEAGVSRAPLLSAPRTETESSSVSAPPGVRRSRSLALPDGATELEVQVGPGNGESSSAALLWNGELSSAALAEALARAPLSAVLGFSSPQLLGLEHLEAPLSALLEEALNAPLSPFLSSNHSRRSPRFAS